MSSAAVPRTPWRADGPAIRDADGGLVAIVATPGTVATSEVVRLLTRAPEMLAAIEALLVAPDLDDAIDRLRAVVERVRGRPFACGDDEPEKLPERCERISQRVEERIEREEERARRGS